MKRVAPSSLASSQVSSREGTTRDLLGTRSQPAAGQFQPGRSRLSTSSLALHAAAGKQPVAIGRTGGGSTMSFVSRAFRGRPRERAPADRLPPGQYVVGDFPVLSAGPTPRTPLTAWTFS